MRINVGGPALTTGGVAWSADQFFASGVAYTTTAAIANTTDDVLVQTERYASADLGPLGYAIPVANGSYTVRLHLAELYFTASNQRVFSANLQGGAQLWYATDALGSIRQTLDGSGAVLGNVAYDPWGVPQQGPSTGSGQAVPTFGFTGELQQGANVYLRARWYNSQRGVFSSRDPFAGVPEQPYSLHPYQYAYAAPTTWTDPSGEYAVDEDGNRLPRPGQQARNPRDLTIWLYRTMTFNTHNSRLRYIRSLNGEWRPPLTLVPYCPDPAPLATAKQAAAGLHFRELVKDHGLWDFKHKILSLLDSRGVTYCGVNGCRTDIEYSVAGNIHYGYIGRAAGFPDWILKAGAGYAEIRDPAHNEEAAKEAGSPYVGPYDSEGKFGVKPSPPFGPILNLGDDPQDNAAVQFGIYLYDKYGERMTQHQFQTELSMMLPALAKNAPSTRPVRADVARRWPYSPTFFNWTP